jgi:hypothetical protein
VLTVVDAVMQAGGDVCHLQATFTHSQILTGNAFKIIYYFYQDLHILPSSIDHFVTGFIRNGRG